METQDFLKPMAKIFSLILLVFASLITFLSIPDEAINNREDLLLDALVIKVVDGDTVKLRFLDEDNDEEKEKEKTVRLIGIDTPETVHPNKPVECMGIEASDYAKKTLENKYIKFESDSSQGEVDRYDRSLGYVHLEDGTNFNKLIIEEGYAHEYTYSKSNPYKYQKEFKEAEVFAQNEERGLWEDGVCE